MGKAKASLTYRWSSGSTYVQNPPYFEDMAPDPQPIADVLGARVLGLFQDSITTDHISPAGSIKRDGPAGRLPDRAPGAAARVQLVRRAPRQPQRDDARHLRQRAHQEPDDGRQGGRQHHPLSLRRDHVDLRCRHALQGGGRAARRSSPARSTAPAPAATGPPRARACSASAPSLPGRSSASTAPIWSAWACSHWCSTTDSPGSASD